MNTYTVTATRQGSTFTSLKLDAIDALAAIAAAEKALRLQSREFSVSEKSGCFRTVNWTGVEFTARRI